ncbi:MAG: hypothetical protein IMF03_07730 [Proteobacteria bacterium]|jgi:hypothetical protein|nr:hypothetical protein [Pseudomonadota bacterium]
MSEKINWTTNVQVLQGPKISAIQTVPVEAYDKIEVVIPGGEEGSPEEATVEVQPGDLGDIKLLLISSDQYSSKLTYTVKDSGGTEGATDVELDSLQVLVGKGAVGLLGVTPVTMEFSNGMGTDKNATITILVGRMAVSS